MSFLDKTGLARLWTNILALTDSIQEQIGEKADQTQLDKKAGRIVTGESFTIDGASVTAGNGAEIFNSYSSNKASGNYSHAEGYNTTASEVCSHAEGSDTIASGKASHAEGINTTASGQASHAEGYSDNKASDIITASNSNEEIIAAWGNNKFTLANGQMSHASGRNCLALGNYSHAEGENTTALGSHSHAEGYNTTASGYYSHAEGYNTTASGYHSHAEGENTTASEDYSHAEGSGTIASGKASHAEGINTTALGYQHAQGHYNNTSTATAGTSSGAGTGTAFVIGAGTSSAAKNAFRVTYGGKIFATSSTITAGADYAEFFEWEDSNPDAEDRRGYFVTLNGDKIKIAEPDDYILGIVSGQPAMIGNGDEEWMGRYVVDEFGAFVTEEFEYEEEIQEEVLNEETGETTIETKTVTKTGIKYKENPDYDPSIPYIQREDRPEWDAIGMFGVLSVRDDGSCVVNGYCKVTEGGTATASESGYRVIKRVNENIVKVIFR